MLQEIKTLFSFNLLVCDNSISSNFFFIARVETCLYSPRDNYGWKDNMKTLSTSYLNSWKNKYTFKTISIYREKDHLSNPDLQGRATSVYIIWNCVSLSILVGWLFVIRLFVHKPQGFLLCGSLMGCHEQETGDPRIGLFPARIYLFG